MAANGLRREPKQHRSRALFDAILEAVGRVAADGNRAITTKKVADLAGVSIGSLYDYFPSKESMIETWSQAVVRRGLVQFHRDVAESAGRTLRNARFVSREADSGCVVEQVHQFDRAALPHSEGLPVRSQH